MERYVWAQVVRHPVGQRPQLIQTVVQGGHHQVDDLQVDAALIDGVNRLQNRPQLGVAHLTVEVLVVPFQVNLDSVHRRT